jgi:hypothetical protein
MTIIRTYIVLTLSVSFSNLVIGQFFENIAPQQSIEHTVNTNLVFGGHGVSFFDFNMDGWDDITFVQENDTILFYMNNEGQFEKVSFPVFFPGETRQVIWVDFDNDGDYDLFITATNGLARLLENNGQFDFTDITLQAGLSPFNTNNFGASFADYDNDGYLDIYLARYSMTGSTLNPDHVNALYRNNGDGTFTNVTLTAGVGDSIQPSFMGTWIDMNNDNYPDLYVINDRSLWGNSLYINNGDGTFTEQTAQYGLEMFGEDPMGVMVADYDNDGDLDMVLANGGPPTKPPRFYINNGDGTFYEDASNYGINVPVTFMCTWGGVWFDMDNDSYLDLYLTTGLLMPASGEVRNYLFHSQDAQYFIDSPGLFDFDHIAASYSVAKGDIDNDGYADLVVQNAKEYNSFLWKNNFGPTTNNNHIKITLEGTVSNKMAIGSWIKVFVNGQTLSHYTRLGENFISQDSQHHIFGVKNANIIDSVHVEYQSGHRDVYYGLNVNEHYYFTEGETLSATLIHNGIGTYCEGSEVQVDLLANLQHDILWSTGESADSILVLESGTYFAQLTSPEGIVYFSDTITIDIVPFPFVIPSVINASCFGESDGEIELNVFYFPGYLTQASIEWVDGTTAFNLQGLSAGYYNYTLTFANCIVEDSVYVGEPSPLEMLYIIVNDAGNGGEIEFMGFGGTPPYTFVINDSIVASSPFNLNAGTHQIELYDAVGCSIGYEFEIESTVSIGTHAIGGAFKLFPNPVSSKLYLNFTDFSEELLEIVLLDVNGRIIDQYAYDNFSTKSNYEVDVSSLAKGSYQVVISTAGKSRAKLSFIKL